MAGHYRNQEMADTGADLCIAFPGGRGTADMVRRAAAAGIEIRRVPG
jgi:predicted Rossmann-fold nucleotide-binding protein